MGNRETGFVGAWRGAVALTVMTLMAGCASHPAPSPRQPSTQPVPRPVPPPGAAAGLDLPDSDGNGGYRTINSGIGRDEAMWHLRSALNVAALSCGGTVAADYNAVLSRHKAALSKAYKVEAAEHRGSAAMDRHITQIYNYFAQPPAQGGFCAVATGVTREARTVAPAGFPDFAVASLARLEVPFTGFYDQYAAYERDLAAWQRGELKAPAARTMLAAAPAVTSRSVPAALPAQSGSWRIQLGAFSGDDAARSAWSKISARLTDVATFKPRYESVPGKALVRVQVGPVADRGDAIRLCAAASSAGFDCFPVTSKQS